MAMVHVGEEVGLRLYQGTLLPVIGRVACRPSVMSKECHDHRLRWCRVVNICGAMTDATMLEFVDHEKFAISVVEYNFPPWGHGHLIIKLIRAGDDSTRVPSTIVETLLEFGTMWIHLGNPMVFDETSWRIVVGIETGSKSSVCWPIRSLHSVPVPH